MTAKEKLKTLMDTGEFDFIKEISKENLWKLLFLAVFVSDTAWFIPLERKKDEWILCSETVDVPEYKVLCCDRYGEELIGYISCSDEQWLCESEETLMYDPIAWMPLPQPWKKGEADG